MPASIPSYAFRTIGPGLGFRTARSEPRSWQTTGEEAIAFASRPIRAFEVIFDVVDCVSFPPVSVIDEQPLAGPG